MAGNLNFLEIFRRRKRYSISFFQVNLEFLSESERFKFQELLADFWMVVKVLKVDISLKYFQINYIMQV